MDWRGLRASIIEKIDGVRTNSEGNSNLHMLIIAAAFLMVTIGLIVAQPGLTPAQHRIADTETLDETAPVASLRPVAADQVTRGFSSLLNTVDDVSVAEAVSRQLRQPIRLTDTDGRHTDLRSLTAAVLEGFGHTPHAEDRFQQMLVQALSEKQSNAYIDALLNTAAGRGEFVVPPKLMMSGGRLDTTALLQALIGQIQG